jgi:hypothetical protein
MKKITNQNWFSSIDVRYNDYLIDKKGRKYLLSDFYSKNLSSKSNLIKKEWYYGILRILKFQNSCNNFFKFILDIDLLIIKNINNVVLKSFRRILDLIVIIFISLIILMLLIIFIIIFPFYIFEPKNKYSPTVQKDLYFFDKNTARHPLIKEREFIKGTSLSSNFIDLSLESKFYIKDFFKLIFSFSKYSLKDIIEGLGLIFNIFLNAPITIIPNYIKSLRSFLILSIGIVKYSIDPKRVICVMSRPDLGVGLFCITQNIDSVFVYLSSTELTVPKKYANAKYITCLDYAFMSSNIIICDIVSKNWLLSQGNENIRFETLNSISNFYVEKRKKDLSELVTKLKDNNVKVITFFNASFGNSGVVSKEANESFKNFSNINSINIKNKKQRLIIITKFKGASNDLIFKSCNVSKSLLFICKTLLVNSFDLFVVSKVVVSVPSSSIIFQASQSGKKVLIYDFQGENDGLRNLENQHSFKRVTNVENVVEAIYSMI